MIIPKNTTIRVYNTELQLLAELDHYESFRITRKFVDIGDFEFHISVEDQVGKYFDRDNVIIMGNDPLKSGYIVSRDLIADNEGTVKWIVRGNTLNGITNRRVTFPNAGKAQYSLSDFSTEAIIIALIRRNMGIYAEAIRAISFIETLPSSGKLGTIEEKISFSTRYKSLSEESVELARAANLGWFFYPNVALGKWVLQFSEGRDRRRGSEKPIVFSESYDNLAEYEYTEDYADYKNTAIVAGEGVGKDRVLVTAYKGGQEPTGQNRYEVFVDARDLQNEDEDTSVNTQQLQSRGRQKLSAEYRATVSFAGKVITSDGYEFGEDFFIGDIVTIESDRIGVAQDIRITSATEIYEADGYQLELVFGDENATVADKIRRFKGALEGVRNT